ncbi:MAG: MFS transporter [Clostridiales bacterium]|nr:MFS transporter [Clostridiales bacterium]
MKNETTKFSVLMGGFFATCLIFGGYYPMFLRDFGYSDFEVGVVMMLPMFSGLVFQLASGYLADRYNVLKQIIISGFVVMAASLPFLFVFSSSKLFVAAFSILAVGYSRSLGGIMDSWVAKLGNVDYGKVRAVGSISYAVFSVVLGQLFTAKGNSAASYFMAAVFAVSMLAVFGLSNPEKQKSVDNMTVRASVAYLAGNRYFLYMTASSFLLGATFASISTYLPALVAEIGGSPAELGVMFFIMAAVEFVVMIFFTKLSSRTGPELLLTIGFFGFFLKNLAFAMSFSVVQAYLACLFQIVSFALVIPGQVLFMSKRVDKSYLAAGLIISQSAYSISMMLANPVCGLLSEMLGVRRMLAIASFPAALAGGIFVLMTKRH